MMKIQRGADDPANPVCEFSFATDGGGGPVTLSCCLGEAIDDFSQTGQVVWPGATIISHFLLSQRGRQLIEGRNVLELGAGVGIPGTFLLLLPHKRILQYTQTSRQTDVAPIVPQATTMTSRRCQGI